MDEKKNGTMSADELKAYRAAQREKFAQTMLGMDSDLAQEEKEQAEERPPVEEHVWIDDGFPRNGSTVMVTVDRGTKRFIAIARFFWGADGYPEWKTFPGRQIAAWRSLPAPLDRKSERKFMRRGELKGRNTGGGKAAMRERMAQERREWILDRFPAEGESVLVTVDCEFGRRRVFMDRLAFDDSGAAGWRLCDPADVVAWTRVPLPYTGRNTGYLSGE